MDTLKSTLTDDINKKYVNKWIFSGWNPTGIETFSYKYHTSMPIELIALAPSIDDKVQ